jgi:hypothetical protein
MLERAARSLATRTSHIGVVIYEGVEPIDIGGTAASSRWRGASYRTSYRTIAEESGGHTRRRLVCCRRSVALRRLLNAITSSSAAGRSGPIQTHGARPMRRLTEVSNPQSVASVCTGALILAAAAFLAPHRHDRRRAAPGEAAAALERLQWLWPTSTADCRRGASTRGVLTSGGASARDRRTLAVLLQTLFGAPRARIEVCRN